MPLSLARLRAAKRDVPGFFNLDVFGIFGNSFLNVLVYPTSFVVNRWERGEANLLEDSSAASLRTSTQSLATSSILTK
jgi:Mlc titration factor MtfA (ptsG expression regulator)